MFKKSKQEPETEPETKPETPGNPNNPNKPAENPSSTSDSPDFSRVIDEAQEEEQLAIEGEILGPDDPGPRGHDEPGDGCEPGGDFDGKGIFYDAVGWSFGWANTVVTRRLGLKASDPLVSLDFEQYGEGRKASDQLFDRIMEAEWIRRGLHRFGGAVKAGRRWGAVIAFAAVMARTVQKDITARMEARQ